MPSSPNHSISLHVCSMNHCILSEKPLKSNKHLLAGVSIIALLMEYHCKSENRSLTVKTSGDFSQTARMSFVVSPSS